MNLKIKNLIFYCILLLLVPVLIQAINLSVDELRELINNSEYQETDLAAITSGMWNTKLGTYIEPAFSSGRGLLIKGTNKYINFSTSYGSSGYGFRDNSGTMQYKNYGGSWAGIGSGGGSDFATTTNDYWFDNTTGITGNTNIITVGTLTTAGGNISLWTNDSGYLTNQNWTYDTNYGVSVLAASTTIPVWFKDNIYASSTLNVDGDAVFAGDLTVAGNVIVDATNGIYFGDTSGINIYDDGSNSLIIVNSLGHFILDDNNGYRTTLIHKDVDEYFYFPDIAGSAHHTFLMATGTQDIITTGHTTLATASTTQLTVSDLSWFGNNIDLTGDLSATGNITGTNLNISNWDNAYTWKNLAIDASDRLKMAYGGTEADLSSIASGGLIVGNGAGSVGVLNKGNNGEMLYVDFSGDVVWTATSTLGFGGTVTSVDFSVPTGLSIAGNPITTSGTLALTYDGGYAAVLTASTTNWNNFYDAPSTVITDGTNLSWSGNTLNATDTNTNANTICSGGTTYLDGEGNCDDISGVYVQAADWTTIDSYPSDCAAGGGVVTGLADTLTCTATSSLGLVTIGGAFHDGFSDFVANEHIDWTGDLGATNIHTGNYPITDSEVPNDITIDLATLASTITVADESADTSCYVGYLIDASGSLAMKTGDNLTFNSNTGILTATGFAGALTGNVTGNADTCTTASAGDAAVDFFGAGVDAVTDTTTCTDIEGTGLSIGGGTLDWSSSGLTWAGNVVAHEYGGLELDVNAYSGLLAISGGNTSEVDSLSELNAQLAGETVASTSATFSGATFDDDSNTLTNIDGENIKNDTIDVDSLDWGAFTDLAEGGAVSWGNITAGELANDSVIDADIDDDGVFAFTGTWNFGGATSLEMPNAADPTCNAAGEFALDTTDNQFIISDSGNAEVVFGKKENAIWKVTIGSTSPAFIAGGLFPVPPIDDGYTITHIECYVVSGTSKVIAVEDASANSTEDITCATTVTDDDGSITNATYTSSEISKIDFGATTGAVDYVSISVFGTWTVE